MSTTLAERVKAAVAAPRTAPDDNTAPGGPEAQDLAEQIASHDEAQKNTTVETVMGWLRRHEKQFAEALPKHINIDQFFAASRAILPGLGRCYPGSVFEALLTCARFGLLPDGHHAVIDADGKLATFIPTYSGLIEVMHRSGRVKSVHADLIYEGDEWTYEPTAPPPHDFTVKPRPDLPRAERGRPVLAYAFAWLEGGARSHVVLMNREDAEEIRDEHSRAYQRAEETGRRDSFWHTDFDAMWRKSPLRRLAKLVPVSAEVVQLLRADEAGDAGTPQIVHAPEPEPEESAETGGVSRESRTPELRRGRRGRGRNRGKNRGRAKRRRAA